MNHFGQLLLLCRPGFEKECAGEIQQLANQLACPAYVKARDLTGFVQLVATTDTDMREFTQQINFRELVFCRQWFAASSEQLNLPEKDRTTPLLKTISTFELEFGDIELAYPDTNEGKSLSRFCKQFKPHLLNALKKKQLMNAHASQRLHILFLDSTQVFIGVSAINNSSPYAMGLPRLRMPSAAPSRSTLKLEEAIHWFVNNEPYYFQNGMLAVDLGAAPGGWTWQLVQRKLLVAAIDNGPMDKTLMQSGMVEHYQTDAFTYRPGKPVNWLVCDMAERPLHVTRLIARWLVQDDCQHAIFNLKLPMKKRLQAITECRELLENELNKAGINFTLRMKQLYHDREEITVCVLRD